MSFNHEFLERSISRLTNYKQLTENAMRQLTDVQLFETPAAGSNSIAIIIQHVAGNMLSRWTDFLETDGEKPWRNRDQEFESLSVTREALMTQWAEGWRVLLETLSGLSEKDLEKDIQIRGESLKVYDAIIRQLMHYGYHVGQIVFLAKWLAGAGWVSLSIPKNGSEAYNRKLGI